MELLNKVCILGKAVCISLCINSLRKDIILFVLLQLRGK